MRQDIALVGRALGLMAIVALSTLVGSGGEVTPVKAQQAPHGATSSGSVAGALRLSASGFGPAPTNTLLPPNTLDRLARRIRQDRWRAPVEDNRWPLDDGKPVVTTDRLDALWHTVESGQTLYRIRHMYKVRSSRLRALNPDIDFSDLHAGQRVLIWKRRPGHVATSYGAASRGRLYNGEPLPDDDHYVILYPHRAFGTYYTISEVERVLGDYYRSYPDADKLIIGDISFRRGRRIHPHKSHRSGRDIDISYPSEVTPSNFRRFHYVRRDDLDTAKTLSLIKDFLDGGYVQYIFMDHHLQKRLRREALAQGATQKWVDRVFQYPDWSGGDAIIRHAAGHRNHFHVRFQCQPTDRRCR